MHALMIDLGLVSSTWLQLLCMSAGDRHLLHFLLVGLIILITFLCIYLQDPHHCTKTMIFLLTLYLSVLRISEVCSSWLRRPDPRALGPEKGQQPAGHGSRALGRACWLEPRAAGGGVFKMAAEDGTGFSEVGSRALT